MAIAYVIFLLSSSYLAFRACALWLRVRRARNAYPSVASIAEDLDCRVYGALLGVAVGDALGLPAEHLPRWLVRLRYPSGPALRSGIARFVRRAGDISDDTQLTIAVARSILPNGEYSHDRFRDELRAFHSFRVAAGRPTTRAAARLFRDPEAEASPIRSDGNGVAIRVAPFAIAHRFDEDDEALLRDVERNARETHSGEHAIAGAKLVALVVKHGFEELDALALRARFPLDRYRRAREAKTLAEQLRISGTSAHALESVTAVLLIVRTCRDDFEAAMRAAFDAGGDVDSIASMVGAILGARFGARIIPARYRALPCASYLAWLAARLREPRPRSHGGALETVRGDIATTRGGAVVNAWNRNLVPSWLLLPQGVSRAIRRAGGGASLREVSRRPPIPLGSVVETHAGDLPLEWILHAAGIDALFRASPRSVRHATASALRLARWLGVDQVSIPILGAGTGGLDPQVALVLVRAECEKSRRHFDRIRIFVQ